MGTFIISSAESWRDQKPFAPLPSIQKRGIKDERLPYKSYSIRIYPPPFAANTVWAMPAVP